MSKRIFNLLLLSCLSLLSYIHASAQDVSGAAERIKNVIKEKNSCWKLNRETERKYDEAAGIRSVQQEWQCRDDYVQVYLFQVSSLEEADKMYRDQVSSPVSMPPIIVKTHKFGEESHVRTSNNYIKTGSSYVFFKERAAFVRIDSNSSNRNTSLSLENALRFAEIVNESIKSISDQSLKFSRPTIVATALKDAPFYHQKVYEDEDYLFAFRHSGRGVYKPGFLIYGKKQKKWIEVEKLTTEHAKLGRYFPFVPTGEKDKETGSMKLVRNPKVPLLAVSWDFTSLKNVDLAPLPLDAYGSLSFPDKITYDNDAKVYRLRFGSVYNIEEMLTEFRVLKADLRKAFSQQSK